MRRLRRWRRMFLARLAVELCVLLLIATVVNVPLGLLTLRSRLTVNRLQQEVAARPAEKEWVWKPPPATGEWPAPTRWAAYRGLFLRHYSVTADQGNERYHMDVQFAGFPLSVVALPHMWWPETKYQTFDPENQPDPGVQVQWVGLLLNPPILAAGAWALLVAPFEVFFAVRWRRRLKRRLCPYCAYPAGRADVCTECGRAA